ncbi:MAG: dihydropteroate synthase [Candidatus Firestonebacteria bacterium]|nr:dihydropteroate synthase [Candidatus Firestonebacteria bacterium]
MIKHLFSCRNYSIDLSKKTLVMGVLNITPDSFSDGGIHFSEAGAVERALKMAEEGADIIDIGGESTRPGASKINYKEEMKRVLPALKKIVKKIKIPISVDTYKYEVAKAALEEGAAIINDITGLAHSPKLAELTARANAGLIIMHIKGTPLNMQQQPKYKDVVKEIKNYLKKRAETGVEAGNKRESIIIDPGLGFGKTPEHNLIILKNLRDFVKLGYPVLIGASRKSFIGKILKTESNARLEGSLAVAVLAVKEGASIIRVHDVKETVRALRVAEAIMKV